MSSDLKFPDIAAPVYPLHEDWEDVGISAGFEDGTEQSRPRFTRSRGSWTLRWNALKNADYEELIRFWKEDAQGKSVSFTWIHPVTGVARMVRFVQKQPFQQVAPGVWSGEMTLREV